MNKLLTEINSATKHKKRFVKITTENFDMSRFYCTFSGTHKQVFTETCLKVMPLKQNALGNIKTELCDLHVLCDIGMHYVM